MRTGDRIGRYTLEAELGRGGMGLVFRAQDELLRRLVALKILLAERDDPEAVGRALREARMAASLDHPNVVAIHDVGVHEGRPFIVFEYVVGRSLRELVDGDASAEERARWLGDVARALAAAHRAGLVHRDVKPENVMLRDDGVIKVLDFGIARRAASDAVAPSGGAPVGLDLATFFTVDGRVSGTPLYMAPEQLVRGEGDARSDQFAWGLVAFELFARRTPWSVPTAAGALRQAIDERPLELGADFGAPPEVDAVVRRALAWSPSARFASMDALLAALPPSASPSLSMAPSSSDAMRAIASAPTIPLTGDATSDVDLARTTPFARREPLRAAQAPIAPSTSRVRSLAVGSIAGAIVATGVVALALWRPAPSPPTIAPSASVPAAPPLVFERPHPLFASDDCAENPLFLTDGTIVFDGPVGSDYHVQRVDPATGRTTVLTHEPGWQLASDVSPDSAFVAYTLVGGPEDISYEIALDGSPPRRIAVGALHPSYAPDGAHVWAGRTDRPERFERATLRSVGHVELPSGIFARRVYEHEGRLLVHTLDASGRAKGMLVYAPDDYEHGAWIIEREVSAVSRSPLRGAYLASVRVDLASKFELWQIPVDGSPPSPLAASGVIPLRGASTTPAEDRIVWSSCEMRSEMLLLRPSDDAWNVPSPVRSVPWEDSTPTASPSTATIVIVSNRDGRLRLWTLDVRDLDGPGHVIPTGDLEPMQPALSHDGKRVVFTTSDALWLVPIDGSAPPKRLAEAHIPLTPAWSRDDETIYFASGAAESHEVLSVSSAGGPVRRERISTQTLGVLPTTGELLYVDDAPHRQALYGLDPATRRITKYSDDAYESEQPLAVRQDGKRAAVMRDNAILELDLVRRRVAQRVSAGRDSWSGFAYTSAGPLLVRTLWRGGLWMADIKAP